MDNTAEWIPEELATEYAKVSASTLARFAEAGYFASSVIEQRRCYPKKALQSVFGVEFPSPRSTGHGAAENIVPFPQSAPSQTVVTDAQQSKTQVESSKEGTTSHATRQAPITDSVQESSTNVVTDTISNISTTHENTSPDLAIEESAIEESAIEQSSNQFKSILAMHADILERQEREIQELRSERDWLRRRIEKYEEKAERDQVLILSSSQAVKQLIDAQGPSKSIIRQALEWLGVLPEEQSKSLSTAISHASVSDSDNHKTT